ncbi:MAG: hypothetical protein F6K01_20780 [Okeania sp. SIO1I7]|nr:hypothetical protein [Okeania sp. SIO1I7]
MRVGDNPPLTPPVEGKTGDNPPLTPPVEGKTEEMGTRGGRSNNRGVR